MKQYPAKSAENASLLGAWRQPATNVCTPLRSRRAWHKARREGRLGEQMDMEFETRYGVKESQAAARNMTISTGTGSKVSHSADWLAWANSDKELDLRKR